MKLIHSYPPLGPEDLTELEQILQQKFGFPPLPPDYKDFLKAHNGGYVSPGYIDEDPKKEMDHSEEIVFPTPLKWARLDDKPVTPCLYFFFVVWLPSRMQDNKDLDDQIFELISSNAYSREDFDILPDQMMSIAKCGHPDAADMLCISLHGSDYGSVYYHYEMWHFPASFHGDYYKRKSDEILDKYGLADFYAIDPDSETGQKAQFELDRVPYVKVADSFGEFLKICRVQAVDG